MRHRSPRQWDRHQGQIFSWINSGTAALRASVSPPQKRSLHISKTAAAQRTSSSIKYRFRHNSKVDAELICASQAALSLVRQKVALFESYSKVARFVCLPLFKPPSSSSTAAPRFEVSFCKVVPFGTKQHCGLGARSLVKDKLQV